MERHSQGRLPRDELERRKGPKKGQRSRKGVELRAKSENKEAKAVDLSKSKELYERAREFTPGGIHSNVRWMEPHPMYFSKALGAKIWDVDGNEYLDCLGNYGALILGHGDHDVIEAIKQQLDTGLTSGVESELSIEVARKMNQIIPCCEKIRFANSGTEAVMHAIQIARGYTKKERILKAEGNYHGWYDYIYCSNRYSFKDWPLPKPYPSSQGLSSDVVSKTLVVPWNDLEKTEEVINRYKDEIAVMIIEPVNHNIGCALPRNGYLEGVRELTKKNNILLIFDEVITGFRPQKGGAQEHFGVIPDITTLGKIIGGGFPIGAYGGRKEIMKMIAPEGNVYQAGTLSGNPVAVAAGISTLTQLQLPSFYDSLNKTSFDFIGLLKDIVKNKGIVINSFKSMFTIFFNENEVNNFEDTKKSDLVRFEKFFKKALDKGLFLSPSQFETNFISATHSPSDLNKTADIISEILK